MLILVFIPLSFVNHVFYGHAHEDNDSKSQNGDIMNARLNSHMFLDIQSQQVPIFQ